MFMINCRIDENDENDEFDEITRMCNICIDIMCYLNFRLYV